MPVKVAKSEKSVRIAKPVEPENWLHRLPGGRAGRVVALALVLAGVGALLGWVVAALSQSTLAGGAQQRESGAVVMISGRDDHGLLQESSVSLFSAPGGTNVVARTPDGTFARVVEQRGEWLKVQVLGNPRTVGWINDFYLRGRLLRTDAGVQVDLVDAREMGSQVYIGVRPAVEPQATPVWVNPAVLQEVGADIHK